MVKLIRIFGLVIQTEKGRGDTIDSICDECVDYEVRETLRQSARYLLSLNLLPRIQEIRKPLENVLEKMRGMDIDIVLKGEISRPLYREVVDPLLTLEDDVQKTGVFKPRLKKRRKSAVQ